MSSFNIDSRVSIKLEFDLAIRLGEFILASGTIDKQIMALGHRLAAMDDKSEESPKDPRKWIPRPGRSESTQDNFAEGLC